MIYDFRNRFNQKAKVLAHLEQAKYPRVLDVGGILHPWARKYVTHYVDLLEKDYVAINDPHTYDDDFKKAGYFQADIGNPFTWDAIKDDVLKNGKFDFAICCHVLEHVPEPSFGISFLTSIAKQGFVSVPSKYIELERGSQFTEEGLERCGVTGFWRGAHCHKWILSLRNDFAEPTLMFWPKYGFLEYLKGLDDWVLPMLALNGEERPGDLSFWYKGSISHQIITDDFLMDDVNPQNACDLYREELKKGL
ncbi:MAG: methyltransferase domain-containing protein [Candidatus Cloacimonas sp.]